MSLVHLKNCSYEYILVFPQGAKNENFEKGFNKFNKVMKFELIKSC